LNIPGKLKNTIYKLDPDLANIRGSSEEVKKRFMVLIEQAWETLGDDYFDQLAHPMDSRVNAVLRAKGWYTHY